MRFKIIDWGVFTLEGSYTVCFLVDNEAKLGEQWVIMVEQSHDEDKLRHAIVEHEIRLYQMEFRGDSIRNMLSPEFKEVGGNVSDWYNWAISRIRLHNPIV